MNNLSRAPFSYKIFRHCLTTLRCTDVIAIFCFCWPSPYFQSLLVHFFPLLTSLSSLLFSSLHRGRGRGRGRERAQPTALNLSESSCADGKVDEFRATRFFFVFVYRIICCITARPIQVQLQWRTLFRSNGIINF